MRARHTARLRRRMHGQAVAFLYASALAHVSGFGFGVWGLGFGVGVWGLGFGVYFRVQGSGFRV